MDVLIEIIKMEIFKPFKPFGKSGNVIKQGAGLREQMEVSNTMYYHFQFKTY